MIFELVSGFYYRISRTGYLVLAFVLYLLFPAVIFRWLEGEIDPGGLGLVPDLHFGFRPDQLYGMFEQMGENGRHYYFLGEAGIDLVYPLVYGSLLAILLSTQLQRIFPEGSRWRLLNFVPILAVLFDFAENANLLIALNRFPARPELPAVMASVMNQGKWIFLMGGVLLLTLLMIARLFGTGKDRHSKTTG